MQFETIFNKSKAFSNTANNTNMIEFTACDGSTVCYHQPIYEDSLLSLQRNIEGSEALKKLAGKYYNIRSNNGYITETYPSVEYHKIAFRMIRDNLHTIMISKEEINLTIKDIIIKFNEHPEFLDSGQRKISFDKEIYKLRSDISNFVFTIRAVLDTFSTLIQTIYGPQSGQYISFNSLLKQLKKENGRFQDQELKEYFEKNLDWFFLLKDVRDYLAHYGALHFSLKAKKSSVLTIEMFRKIEVLNFIQIVTDGFDNLLKYLDEHCSNIVIKTA